MKETLISDELEFKAMVHTVQISTENNVLSDFEIRNKGYVKDFYIRKNRARYVINPNKYGSAINNVRALEEVMNTIVEELCISDYHFDRIDIAIDTSIPFEDLYKINCYLKELFSVHIKANNSFRSIGDNLRARNTIVISRSIDLEIYDKYLESGGLDTAKTRIEFRFKRPWKNQGFKESIQRVRGILASLTDNISSLDERKSRQLYYQYVKEKDQTYEGRARNLTDFVTKYADHIYTSEMLRNIHKALLKGHLKHWIYTYRKSGRVITLISKSMLQIYCGKMQSALKQFSNGRSSTRLLQKSPIKKKAV